MVITRTDLKAEPAMEVRGPVQVVNGNDDVINMAHGRGRWLLLWLLPMNSQALFDFGDGTPGGAERTSHIAGFRRARFTSAERKVFLPDSGDPWRYRGLGMSAPVPVVGSGGEGIGGPVFEDGGAGVQRLRPV